jgi:hypothetical protein
MVLSSRLLKYEVLLTAKGATERVNQKLSTTLNPEITAQCQQATEAPNIFKDSENPKQQTQRQHYKDPMQIGRRSQSTSNCRLEYSVVSKFTNLSPELSRRKERFNPHHRQHNHQAAIR